ncbi:hypothetical protein F4821DRAFT_67696 [Hypoxylon rubiginosum]|uniref:Uncharacterized protein n=1 Tax=Hypoxylon rubiginosum TaxID=110542 RepID=A0ACC0CIL3_9PEZI|nr:hypothetical protein F4821DRAFT_67696 [Hypoxylon rubiginosum]
MIGGITEPHEWNLDLTLDTAIVRRMRECCEKFLPGLERARLDPGYPFAQGLRPFRGQNVKVERELRREGSRIVHSYGHRGPGWSLSFGCAQDVALLVNEVLRGVPAKPMSEVVREWKAARHGDGYMLRIVRRRWPLYRLMYRISKIEDTPSGLLQISHVRHNA